MAGPFGFLGRSHLYNQQLGFSKVNFCQNLVFLLDFCVACLSSLLSIPCVSDSNPLGVYCVKSARQDIL